MEQDVKCVMIIDSDLPLGLIANTAAVLAMTIGQRMPELIGDNVLDATGRQYVGITKVPVPILRGEKAAISTLREQLDSDSELFLVDFVDTAQMSKEYDDYTTKMAAKKPQDLDWLGLAICGPKKKVNKLTGQMALLR